MENYNNEQEHDWCLISLVEALDEAARLDIFRDAFWHRRRSWTIEVGRAQKSL